MEMSGQFNTPSSLFFHPGKGICTHSVEEKVGLKSLSERNATKKVIFKKCQRVYVATYYDY